MCHLAAADYANPDHASTTEITKQKSNRNDKNKYHKNRNGQKQKPQQQKSPSQKEPLPNKTRTDEKISGVSACVRKISVFQERMNKKIFLEFFCNVKFVLSFFFFTFFSFMKEGAGGDLQRLGSFPLAVAKNETAH